MACTETTDDYEEYVKANGGNYDTNGASAAAAAAAGGGPGAGAGGFRGQQRTTAYGRGPCRNGLACRNTSCMFDHEV